MGWASWTRETLFCSLTGDPAVEFEWVSDPYSLWRGHLRGDSLRFPSRARGRETVSASVGARGIAPRSLLAVLRAGSQGRRKTGLSSVLSARGHRGARCERGCGCGWLLPAPPPCDPGSLAFPFGRSIHGRLSSVLPDAPMVETCEISFLSVAACEPPSR